MSVLSRVLRSGEGKKLKAIESLVPDINSFEPEIEKLSDHALQAKTGEFKQRLEKGEDLNDLLIEAFAVVREAARRVIGQRHYDVQMMGGIALHLGWVAEMRTGEGKTLVSTLAAYLNGLTGRGVHLCTVNDYLATRDSEWMGQLHKWLGLSVGLVVPSVSDRIEKREAYLSDITYGTNNELGFDYLRDNMALSKDELSQRGHAFCIVDEVDSILIDEARTPLIISGKASDALELYQKFSSVVRNLKRDLHYDVDEEKRIIAPTEEGVRAVEKALGVENLYDQVSSNLVHQLHAAIKAKELYQKDRDYIVTDGEVRIVDEFTGRVLEGRRWSDGIHQAVEAKESVSVKEENQTLATITLQNYFRMYEKLSGMTGTASTEAAELAGIYGLQVVTIPTHKPMVRDDRPDLVYKTEAGKFQALVSDIVERQSKGQPVLVGTISVEKSEKISRELEKRGIGHEVLNAKQHFREADIVSQAGRPGAVTVATNMAGRGVDIMLGGNPSTLGEKVLESGGLYVLGTERHESRRIDNQLRGRSGRQGDVGESRFYLSLEDELMRLFASGALRNVMDKTLPEDVPIESKMVSKAIERAQTTVEQKNAEARKNVLKYDEVMNEQRKVIYRRRNEILNGADLRDSVIEAIDGVVAETLETFCAEELPEEWDLTGLLNEINGYWPNSITPSDLDSIQNISELEQLLTESAFEAFDSREKDLGLETLREVERQVMLRIIDQRWREHLYEMDHLRDGIHLRAMAQKDPTTEWQREGFELFQELTELLQRDLVRYIMRVQLSSSESEDRKPEEVTTSGPEGPVTGAAAVAMAAGVPTEVKESKHITTEQIIKDEKESTPRNSPCHCGSGRKFKHCHGR
ncbi:MAG: preprotein translocase subunit SecA [Acidimicrobiales bacterium]|jgi:preprotein translocase subunit SecA|nr:preprotein translocase subunit SecA [Acidimicrobiales bacterium]MDP6285765.1 preprotein translocase subunit SecA [Acidimicrobiales bacterium]HJL91316.1 preprotein translocase subunit SecA [Acidimicrobiales bacterium]HJO40169.1 preprotein translocase subunit SecA [Acidimicrobiales bacterium]|tara:strand:+ start:329 stop:2917 length:2589 start_codon:yes stop_codon:yes gene_type:complete